MLMALQKKLAWHGLLYPTGHEGPKKRGKANSGAPLALPCAGIIQIRFGGYFSPGTSPFQDP
jgi:hypothetical protein